MAARGKRGSRVKAAFSKAKRIVRRKKKVSPADEGRPYDRLGWEILDLVPEEPAPPPGVLELAAAAVTGPPQTLASRRIAALSERHEAFSPLEAPAILGAPNWVQVGPTAIPNGQSLNGTARVLVSGRVTAIAIHPTNPAILYLATARGGVWKTADAGVSWAPLTDNELSLANGAIALAPSAPDTVYAGTGEGNLQFYVKTFPLNSSPDNYLGAGMLKSTDGGASWMTQGLAEFTGQGFFRIVVHPTNPDVAFAATSAGLFRTIDGGASWVKLTSGLPAISNTIIASCDVAIDPSNPNVVYAAFFADGVYRSASALAANPAFTKVPLPDSPSRRRIVVAIARSQPDRVYALVTNGEKFGGLFVSTPGTNGATWTQVAINVDIGAQSSYNLEMAVDPSTPDIVYISALSVYKLVRSGGVWSASDIGQKIHSDQHALAFDPTDPLTIFAGGDGGIYKSRDGGVTWLDGINRGMTITQFEFLDQHPTSDAVVMGGTQDNGTEAYRNSEIFYHADEGDGSFVAIDPNTPANVLHGFYTSFMGRSTTGGDFGTWDWSIGPSAQCLFYPPFTLGPNPMHIAFGGKGVHIDTAQGTGGWPTTVALPGLVGLVSALHWVSANRIYAGTTSGQVYRLIKNPAWTATLVSAPPLPSRWVWDVTPDPNDIDVVFVAMAGFGTPHVWRGNLAGTPSWTSISGSGVSTLPDAPVFAFAIRPGPPREFFVGTDVGVYRSTDDGGTWSLFNSGLPNTAIYDLKYHATGDMLRAGTHGRGLWERWLNAPPSVSDVSLYTRDNVMASGRFSPAVSGVLAAFNDPLRHVSLGDTVSWWESADIKVDAPVSPGPSLPPSYQMNVADVNDLTFETKLQHRNPQRGRVARVYVQIHNRGVVTANNVTVKLLRANASIAALPDLPNDFWTAFPGDGNQADWKSVGTAKTTSVFPGRSAILEWDWTPGPADVEVPMLAVIDCPDDPIPPGSKIPEVWKLVPNERRVTLLHLRVIDVPPSASGPMTWSTVTIPGDGTTQFNVNVTGNASRVVVALPKAPLTTFDVKRFTGTQPSALSLQAKKSLAAHVAGIAGFETAHVLDVAKTGASLVRVVPTKTKPVQVIVGILHGGKRARVTVTQEAGGAVRGGCTLALRG